MTANAAGNREWFLQNDADERASLPDCEPIVPENERPERNAMDAVIDGMSMVAGMRAAEVAADSPRRPWPVPAQDRHLRRPARTRRKRDRGRCLRRAGWQHVGFTVGGLYVVQQLPGAMPPSAPVPGAQPALFSLWGAA